MSDMEDTPTEELARDSDEPGAEFELVLAPAPSCERDEKRHEEVSTGHRTEHDENKRETPGRGAR